MSQIKRQTVRLNIFQSGFTPIAYTYSSERARAQPLNILLTSFSIVQWFYSQWRFIYVWNKAFIIQIRISKHKISQCKFFCCQKSIITALYTLCMLYQQYWHEYRQVSKYKHLYHNNLYQSIRKQIYILYTVVPPRKFCTKTWMKLETFSLGCTRLL